MGSTDFRARVCRAIQLIIAGRFEAEGVRMVPRCSTEFEGGIKLPRTCIGHTSFQYEKGGGLNVENTMSFVFEGTSFMHVMLQFFTDTLIRL